MLEFNSDHHRTYKYFGRKISKKISEPNIYLYDNHYYQYSIDKQINKYYKDRDRKKKISFQQKKFSKINIEIGFGDGEYLLNSAISRPNELFIGSEVYKNGVIKVLKKIINLGIENIKLSNMNSLYLLNALKAKSVDNLSIINPDPWIKKRHNKRRLINYENIKLFSKLIKSSNSIFITTDSKDYIENIENILKLYRNELGNFNISILSSKDELYGISRYQRKAIKKDKKIYLLKI